MFRGSPGSCARALPILLLGLAALLASCEENTTPVITKFSLTPDCAVITEHTRATLDEDGNLIHETEAAWAGQTRFVREVVGTAFDRVETEIYNAGAGGPDQFPTTVSGKIAHVRRSMRPFDEIVANAEVAGAAGLIISNNEGDLQIYREVLTRPTSLVVMATTRQAGDALDANDGTMGRIFVSPQAITEADPIIRNGQAVSDYLAVQFFARASGGNALDDPTGANAPLEFQWDMGDGVRYSNITSGVHYYVEPSDELGYPVRLVVTDKDGDSDTKETFVFVGEKGTDVDIMQIQARSGDPRPSFRQRIAVGDTTCIFNGWLFDFSGHLETPCKLSGLTEQYEWHWDFGDGEELLHSSEFEHLYAFDETDVGPHTRQVILTVTEQSSGIVRADTLQGDEQIVVPAGPVAALQGLTGSWQLLPTFGIEGERCDFKGWEVPFRGDLQTPCGELGSLRPQLWQTFDWRWTFDIGTDTTGTNEPVVFYPYITGDPGPHSHDVNLRVHEIFRRPSAQNDTLATESETFVVDLPVGRAVAIDVVEAEAEDPVPAFHPEVANGDTFCVFDGWDVQYIGTLDAPCFTLFEPNAQYQWSWDFDDGGAPVSAGSPVHRYVYDPENPDPKTVQATLSIRDTWSNKTKGTLVEVDIPASPAIAVDEIIPMAAEPVPVFQLIDETICVFVGWDVEFSGIVETPCGTLDDLHPQYEWTWRFGDATLPVSGVSRPTHRYAFDAENPEAREVTASLAITDSRSEQTLTAFLLFMIPEGPVDPGETCPDNAKR